ILDIDQSIARRHPGMRVGFARIWSLTNADRHNAITDCQTWYAGKVLQELLEPLFEIEPVPDDEIRRLRLDDITRRGLVAVNFSSGLRDGNDLRRIAGYIRNDVPYHREGRHDLERPGRLRVRYRSCTEQNAQKDHPGRHNRKRISQYGSLMHH